MSTSGAGLATGMGQAANMIGPGQAYQGGTFAKMQDPKMAQDFAAMQGAMGKPDVMGKGPPMQGRPIGPPGMGGAFGRPMMGPGGPGQMRRPMPPGGGRMGPGGPMPPGGVGMGFGGTFGQMAGGLAGMYGAPRGPMPPMRRPGMGPQPGGDMMTPGVMPQGPPQWQQPWQPMPPMPVEQGRRGGDMMMGPAVMPPQGPPRGYEY